MRIEDSIYKYGSIFQTTNKTRLPADDGANDGGIPSQSFNEVLKQVLPVKELTFSKHAIQRLETRDIKLFQDDLVKISNAVQKAKSKGVENTLVLSEKGAFIINVSNHVVITAMNPKEMKENIFTQIDGAVVI
jgi:flagellar operon protein